MNNVISDLKILYHLALKPVRGTDHGQRMESFYAGQAEAYDHFRERLLHGRRELFEAIPAPEGGIWVDMGGGTGSNLQYLGRKIEQLHKLYVVDLSPSLLKVAQDRIVQQDWKNVEAIQADAAAFRPPEGSADIVTFSYSLTMIPDWFAAVENAVKMLKPGGKIGVVDFYVSRRHPPAGMRKHGWLTRSFWPLWFSTDNVNLSPDHVHFLHRYFKPVSFWENRAKIPWLPLLRAPYYLLIGEK